MPRNRPVHEIVSHEDLPAVLERLGLRFEDDLREALQFPEALRDRGISESDIRQLKEDLNPRPYN